MALEAFLTDCYAGGRNESFFIGPSPVGVWRDYDLAGAYSTGLVDMPLIDFENPRPSLDVEDYLGHVAGYALVEFAHPDDTRFPVFAVSRGGKGLIFPLKGTAYARARTRRRRWRQSSTPMASTARSASHCARRMSSIRARCRLYG